MQVNRFSPRNSRYYATVNSDGGSISNSYPRFLADSLKFKGLSYPKAKRVFHGFLRESVERVEELHGHVLAARKARKLPSDVRQEATARALFHMQPSKMGGPAAKDNYVLHGNWVIDAHKRLVGMQGNKLRASQSPRKKLSIKKIEKAIIEYATKTGFDGHKDFANWCKRVMVGDF